METLLKERMLLYLEIKMPLGWIQQLFCLARRLKLWLWKRSAGNETASAFACYSKAVQTLPSALQHPQSCAPVLRVPMSCKHDPQNVPGTRWVHAALGNWSYSNQAVPETGKSQWNYGRNAKTGKQTISMTTSCLFSAIYISMKAVYEKHKPFLKEHLFAVGSDFSLLKGGDCLCPRLILYWVGREEQYNEQRFLTLT